jgi:hypothetical protein
MQKAAFRAQNRRFGRKYRFADSETTAPADEYRTPAEMIVTLATVAMTQDDAHEVFGSLPRRRPGIESPRRARAREAAAKEPAPAAPAPAEAASRSEIAELEHLALAGARFAAGAAASSLRLAGRTVGEIGRVVGRR